MRLFDVFLCRLSVIQAIRVIHMLCVCDACSFEYSNIAQWRSSATEFGGDL